MREYELNVIVQPEISEEGSAAILARLDEALEPTSGRLFCDDLGKRKLAYEIKRFQKGHYYLLSFLDDGQIVPQLERMLGLDESVLRFLTVKVSDRVHDVEARKAEAQEREAEQKRRAAERAERELEEARAREEAEEARARVEAEERRVAEEMASQSSINQGEAAEGVSEEAEAPVAESAEAEAAEVAPAASDTADGSAEVAPAASDTTDGSAEVAPAASDTTDGSADEKENA